MKSESESTHAGDRSTAASQTGSSGDDRPFVRWIGRLGYAAKGTVYVIIGTLAIMQVFNLGEGGGAEGSTGALVALDRQPMGDVLLYAIAIGLIFYTLWRFAQGLLDVEDKGSDASGLVKRGGLVISGALYGVLAWTSFRLAMGAGSESAGSGGSSETTAQALSQPGGEWLVMAAGIGFGLTGLYQLWRAWSLDFQKHWNPSLNGDSLRWLTRLSRFGIAARAIIFVIMAGYIVQAGLESQASEAQGLGGVLKSFAGQPWLLGISAAGLLCYAAYSWTNAVYRRIPANQTHP